MPAHMKVHAYHVVPYNHSPDFTVILEQARRTPLARRLRQLGHQEVRLENIHAPQTPRNNSPFWLMDFTRLRFDHGPGKASRTNPIAGFELDADEGFGEETAALYDPRSHHMLVQYNHFGPRAGTMREYFSFFDPGNVRQYEFLPRMDLSSERKFAEKQVIKKIHFKVAASKISDAQRNAGVSLERSLAVSNSLNGQTIEVVVSAGRGNSMLSMARVHETVQSLQRLVNWGESHNDPVVEKFSVVGKTTPDSSSEEIDMLAPKLESTIDGLVMGSDRRYTNVSRWQGLIRASAGWSDIISP